MTVERHLLSFEGNLVSEVASRCMTTREPGDAHACGNRCTSAVRFAVRPQDSIDHFPRWLAMALAERGEHGFGQQAPGRVRHYTGEPVVTLTPMASQLHLSLRGSSFESGPVYCGAL